MARGAHVLTVACYLISTKISASGDVRAATLGRRRGWRNPANGGAGCGSGCGEGCGAGCGTGAGARGAVRAAAGRRLRARSLGRWM